jgi:hypothetical protein
MGWQSTGEIGEALDQQRRPTVVVGSDEQRRGEVGDLIWSPVKEETRQGGFTTAMCVLGGGGGTTGGWPKQWWWAPVQRSWSGGELEWRSLQQRRPWGKVGAVGPCGGARWTGECDGEHEEENVKGKPSTLSLQMI